MAKMITRTVQSTLVRFKTVGVDPDGNITSGPEASDLIADVKITDKTKAELIISKKYPNDTIIVTGLETIEEVRGITLDCFMEHSVIVKRPASQQKKS